MNAEKLELANKLAAEKRDLAEKIQRIKRTIEICHPDDARNARLHFSHLSEYANQDEPILPAHKFKAVFERELKLLQRELTKKQRQFKSLK